MASHFITVEPTLSLSSNSTPLPLKHKSTHVPALPRLLMLAATLIAVITACALLIHTAQGAGNTFSLAELTTPPEDCEAPCWHGIRPGLTTLDEAVALLEAQSDVESVRVSAGKISWWWTGEQNPIYDANGRAFDGRIETVFVEGETRVSSIVLNTTKPLGDYATALGDPDNITLYTVHPENNSQREGIVYVAHYEQFELSVFNLLTCPMSVDDFWHSPSYVAFGQPNLVFEGDVIETETLPTWFFRDEAPGCGA